MSEETIQPETIEPFKGKLSQKKQTTSTATVEEEVEPASQKIKSTTLIETPTVIRKGQISVRPYFDPTRENMGLEKYGLVIHDGVSQGEQLTCLESNGVRRYVTGLNEFAPEVRTIKDPEKKEAVIREIRKKVAFLERALGANHIKEDDENFWDKVVTVSPNNFVFWDKINIAVANDPLFLDPENPMDLIKITCIEARGFSLIAPSLEDAKSRPVAPKFYLDKYEETASTKVEITKLRNKAGAELQRLYDTNVDKLMYIAKILDGNSSQYRKNTSNDVIYANMDAYIAGKGVEGSKKRAPQSFLDAIKLPMEDLILKALIKDASFYRYIVAKGDGMLYHAKSNTMLGRNSADCLEFLRNAMNDKTLTEIQAEVEKEWNY